MLISLGVALIGLTCLAVLALAAKYAFGPVPTDYHEAILTQDGGGSTLAVRTVLQALYRVLAGLLVALALGLAALTLSVRGLGGPLIPALMVGMTLASAGIAALATFRVERQTGVRTPWRLSAGLMVFALVAIGLIM